MRLENLESTRRAEEKKKRERRKFKNKKDHYLDANDENCFMLCESKRAIA
jgi:hypothetical protein